MDKAAVYHSVSMLASFCGLYDNGKSRAFGGSMKASVSVTIDISKRHVWEAIVFPEQRKKWWAEGIELDARVGGIFRDFWLDGSSERGTFGVVEGCVPGELLAMSWRESDWPEGATSRVSFAVESEGFKARVCVTQELVAGFSAADWEHVCMGFLPGWSELLGSLKLFLHRCSLPSSHDLVFRKTLPWPVQESFERLHSHHVFAGASIVASEPSGRMQAVWGASEMHPIMCKFGHTLVDFILAPSGKSNTNLVITHTGFGFSNEWQAARMWQDMFWKKFLTEFVDEM